jgi:CRISPR-associated Csx2 family protein
MPRKVMLSFVGTGNYIPCRYVLKDRTPSRVVTYVQEALAEYFFEDRETDDAIILFFTDKAAHTHKEDIVKSLDGFPVKVVSGVPESFSEDDNWRIFSMVFDVLQEGDEVILDITHAFRSYVALASVLMSYAKALKGVQVKGIYYGAFESLGAARDVESKYPDPGNRIAPLVDMSIYSTLQDWTYASATYIDTGNPEIIGRLTEEYIKPRLKASKGEDGLARRMRSLALSLKNLELELATVRAYDIEEGKSVKNALSVMSELKGEEDPVFEPLSGLFDRISNNLERFSNAPAQRRWVSAVDWYIRHKRIQQGITQLLEGLISEFCILSGHNPHSLEDRTIVSQSIAIHQSNKERKDWLPPARDHIQKVEAVLSNGHIMAMASVFDSLNTCRNDINHAGYRENHKSAEAFQKALRITFEKILKWLDKEGESDVPEP